MPEEVPEPEIEIEELDVGEVPDDDPVALNREVLIELRRLNMTLERFNRKRRYYALSLTGGMARGFGAALGASLIFALVLALMSRLITVPVVGEYVRDVVEFVRLNSPAGVMMPDLSQDSPVESPQESLSPSPTPLASPSPLESP